MKPATTTLLRFPRAETGGVEGGNAGTFPIVFTFCTFAQCIKVQNEKTVGFTMYNMYMQHCRNKRYSRMLSPSPPRVLHFFMYAWFQKEVDIVVTTLHYITIEF